MTDVMSFYCYRTFNTRLEHYLLLKLKVVIYVCVYVHQKAIYVQAVKGIYPIFFAIFHQQFRFYE